MVVQAHENPSECVTRNGKAKSAPGDVARIDPIAALGAGESRHGDFALFATGAHVSVQEHLHVRAQACPAMRAAWMQELEIPLLPTKGATVIGDDDHLAVRNVALFRRVAAGEKGLVTVEPGKPVRSKGRLRSFSTLDTLTSRWRLTEYRLPIAWFNLANRLRSLPVSANPRSWFAIPGNLVHVGRDLRKSFLSMPCVLPGRGNRSIVPSKCKQSVFAQNRSRNPRKHGSYGERKPERLNHNRHFTAMTTKHAAVYVRVVQQAAGPPSPLPDLERCLVAAHDGQSCGIGTSSPARRWIAPAWRSCSPTCGGQGSNAIWILELPPPCPFLECDLILFH